MEQHGLKNKEASVTFADSANLDAFGGLRTVSPFGVSENTNVESREDDLWEEPITGVILEYTPILGSFGNGNEIRGILPTGRIAIGTIITDTAGVSMRISVNRNNFQAGDTITDQTTGATATIDSTNTGADIQHNYNRGSVILKVTSASTDSARRHQIKRNFYLAGKSHRPQMTTVIGSYDDLYIVRRDTISGTLNTVKIHQNDPSKSTDGVSVWNSDTLDGNGESGVTLDCTKSQIIDLDLQMLKVGRARFNFNIDGINRKAHEFLNANRNDSAYIRQPSQPIQYSIHNDGTYTYKRIGYFQNGDGIYLEAAGLTSTSDLQLEEVCSACTSEGGYTQPGKEISTPITWADERAITTRTPIIFVREATTGKSGNQNESTGKLLDFGVFVRTNDCLIEAGHVHDPVDIVGTFTAISDSGLEFSTDITSFTGRPTHIIDHLALAAGGSLRGDSGIVESGFINLHSFISQNTDSTNSQGFVLYGTPRTGTSDVLPHITMLQITS